MPGSCLVPLELANGLTIVSLPIQQLQPAVCAMKLASSLHVHSLPLPLLLQHAWLVGHGSCAGRTLTLTPMPASVDANQRRCFGLE